MVTKQIQKFHRTQSENLKREIAFRSQRVLRQLWTTNRFVEIDLLLLPVSNLESVAVIDNIVADVAAAGGGSVGEMHVFCFLHHRN
nr:uncharacterized protein LOC109179594 [Ipomoea batatas]